MKRVKPVSHNILILISSLQAGGAERVASMLANYWSERAHSITIVLLASEGCEKFYAINEAIEIVNLDVLKDSTSTWQALQNNVLRIKAIRMAVKNYQPDIVLSLVVETNILAILSTLGVKIPLIVAEHADPHLAPQGKLWQKLRDILYPRAKAVVLLDDYFTQFYSRSIQKKCVVIPNPVKACIQKNDMNAEPQNNDKIQIIAVGRFIKEKRFDRLLKAFSKVHLKHPNTQLTLLGDGETRPQIEEIIEALGLQKSVVMTGIVSDPEQYLSKSDIFVLTSDSEGFPMVLCEAMSCGLSVVSTEYHAGANTTIQSGVDGFVVEKEDLNSLVDKINLLVEDKARRQDMGKRAKQSMQRYSIQSVDKKWQTLFNKFAHA